MAVLIGLVLVAELTFGGWVFGSNYGMMNIPRNVSRTFDVSNLYGGVSRARYTRDRHGLRGRYEDPSRIDILTIGGSTTNQLYIDDELTWQAVMTNEFRTAKIKLTVVDAAVDGQSSLGHIAAIDRWFPLIPGLKPRFVLAYVGINDMAVSGAANYDSMQSPELSRRIRYLFVNNSALYNLYRTVRGMIRAREAKLIHGKSPYDGVLWEKAYPMNERKPASKELAKRLDEYKARLEILIGKIRGLGARAIIVTQPAAMFRLRGGWVFGIRGKDGKISTGFYEILTAINDVSMTVCREKGAVCVDLGRELQFEDGDFYDNVHNTPQGTAKIGRYLYRSLKDAL